MYLYSFDWLKNAFPDTVFLNPCNDLVHTNDSTNNINRVFNNVTNEFVPAQLLLTCGGHIREKAYPDIRSSPHTTGRRTNL